jgi:acyl-CoA synthetase (AMP-forming)/AMP-acid ligase II
MVIVFSELDIKKDDFVVTQLPNAIEFILAHYALMKLGAVTVPVVMPFRGHELDYILELSGAFDAYTCEHGTVSAGSSRRTGREEPEKSQKSKN